MALVTVDLRKPWPDLKPGDVVFGVISSGGIVEQVTVDRALSDRSNWPDI